MVSQQLLDYIKQQMQQGVSQDQIKSSLMANGWQAQDIEEGLDNINSPNIPTAYSTAPVAASSGVWKIIAGIVIGVAVLGGGAYLASQTIFKSEETPKISNEQTQQPPKETVTPTPAQETPVATTILDCEQDLKCLIQASTNCKPAKVVYAATVDIFGVKQTAMSFFEIKGSEMNKCSFYLRTEKIDLEFPPNIPQEVVNQQKEIYKKLEGRDGICKFNTSELTAMLTRWEKGNFESGEVSCQLTPSGNVCETEGGDFGAGECQGTYFEQPSL